MMISWLAKFAIVLAVAFSDCSYLRPCAYSEGSELYEKLNAVVVPADASAPAAQAVLRDVNAQTKVTTLFYSRYCKDNGTVRNALLFSGGDMVPLMLDSMEAEPRLEKKVDTALWIQQIDSNCQCVRNDPSALGRLTREREEIKDYSDRSLVKGFYEITDRIFADAKKANSDHSQ
ncbi:MAG: hypothetical protein R2682_00560 [Pyrinomonadaceae bacterium]